MINVGKDKMETYNQNSDYKHTIEIYISNETSKREKQ